MRYGEGLDRPAGTAATTAAAATAPAAAAAATLLPRLLLPVLLAPFLPPLPPQIESINEMFVEARDEIEYAQEEAGEHPSTLLQCFLPSLPCCHSPAAILPPENSTHDARYSFSIVSPIPKLYCPFSRDGVF